MKLRTLILLVSFHIPFIGVGYCMEYNKNWNKIDTSYGEKNGDTFTKKLGQCVGFVQEARPDIAALGPIGVAKNIISKAVTNHFEVNNIPRVGAVIVMPNLAGTGHVGIVKDVKSYKDGIYTITIIDANAKGESKFLGAPSKIRERDITYNPITKEARDDTINKSKAQTNVQFVQEKTASYDKKYNNVKDYINQEYKSLLKQNPSDNDMKKYAEQLISGVLSPDGLKKELIASPQGQKVRAQKLAEYTKAQEKAKKAEEDAANKSWIQYFIDMAKNDAKTVINTYIKVPIAQANTPGPISDTSKISSQNVVNQVNDVTPKIVSVGISVNRTADTLNLIFKFSKPMEHSVPGEVNTSGVSTGAGGSWSNFVWSNNGKTATSTFTPSGGTNVSPAGSTVTYATDNNTFVDTRNKFAPAKSGSTQLTQ